MKLKVALCSAALLLPLGLAVTAAAHHSFAMFDRGRTNSITGTVKEFDLINPHGWLQLAVADAKGQVREWSLETGGPAQMERAGWRAQSLTAGDKVTAVIHPLKDGSNGGQLVSVTLPNGETLSTGGPGRNRGPANGGRPE